jgi:filamentous hemagglutinin family protein
MTRTASPVRHRRLLLVVTSALGGMVAVPALAQNAPAIPAAPVIPTAADVVGKQTNLLGLDPQITNPNGDLNVRLRANNTVIDWNGFNIPENRTANFDNGTLSGSVAVLNRDVSGNVSQLLGKLTSDPSVAVWVYNPNGIVVGAKAAFATGSLVLSTLDVDTADFIDGGRSYRLSTAAGNVNGITVMNGAQIKVEGGTRGLVMVAPTIDADGTFQAVGQDIAFVTATDVTLTYNPNSPLSVTLNRGTAVPGRSQYVRGTVGGADALFALASQRTVTDALLQVDAGVTMASAGTRGIVLSAGRPADPVDGVAFAGALANTDGVAGLSVAGALTVTDRDGSDILAGASGAASFTGGLASERDVELAAAGPLSVAAGVVAGRDYRLTGRGIALGGAAPAIQRAGGDVRIASTDGDITGAAGLAVRSGGSATLVLATDGTAAGNILFDPTSSLTGGSDRQGYVDLRLRDAGNRIALGDVTARGLRQAVGAGAVRNGLTTTAALGLGTVDVRDALALEAAGVTAGALASDRAVTIVATGALSTGAITARGGSVSLTGSGATLVAGDIAATSGTSDIVLNRDGATSLRGLSAARDVRIDAGGGALAIAGTVVADRGAATLQGGSIGLAGGTLRSAGAIDLLARSGGIASTAAVSLTSTSTRTADFVRLQATGVEGIVLAPGSAIVAGADRALRVGIFNAAADAPLSLGAVTARSLGALATVGGDATRPGRAIVAGGNLTFGSLDLIDGFAAESTGGDLTVGRIAVTGTGQGISLRAANGTLSVQRDVAASGDVTLASGTALLLGTVESRDGRVDLTSKGAVTLTTLTGRLGVGAAGSQVTVDGVRGGPVALTAGAGDVRIGSIQGGTVTASATGGAVTVRDALSATGAVAITATGDARVGGAVGGTAVTVRAGGDAAFLGGILAIGDVALTGRSVTLAGTQSATGGYAVTSTAGDITGRSGVAIIADSDGRGGEALTLTARGGGIVFDPASSLRGGNGTSAVTVSADGGAIGIGDVRARALMATGATAIRTGNLALVDGLSLQATGGIVTGTIGVQTGGVTLAGGGGAVTAGTITAGGGIALSGTSLTFGRVQGGALTATAASGSLTAGDIGVAGAAMLAASGALNVGAITAAGIVGLTGGGDVRFGRVEAAAVTATAGGALTARDIVSRGGAALTATGAVGVGAIRATGAVALGGARIVAGGVEGAGVTATAGGGDLTIGDIASRGDAALTATGKIGAGAIAATGAAAIRGTSISAAGVDAASLTAAASAGDLTARDIASRGAATLTATGAIGVGAIRATGAVAIDGARVVAGGVEGAGVTAAASGGDLTIGDIVSGGDAALTASGTIGAGAIGATGTAVIRGASISAGGVDAAGVTAAASGGDLTTGDIVSRGAAALTAIGMTRVGAIRATGITEIRGASISAGGVEGGSVTAVAGAGALTAGDIVSRGAATLTATGATRVGAIRATGNAAIRGTTIVARDIAAAGLTAAAGAGDLTAGDLAIGDTVVIDATGATAIGAITAGGSVALTGSSIAFGRLDAGALTATAAGGAVRGTDILVRGAATIDAAGAIGIGSVRAGGGVALRGTTIAAGGITGTSLLATAADGGIVIGDSGVGDAVTITAARGPVDLGSVTATRGNVAITAGGRLVSSGIVAGGAASLATTGTNADILLANGLTANGSVTLAGTGNIRAPLIVSRTGDLTIAAPAGELTGFAPGTVTTLRAGPGRTFALTIGGAARLGDIAGGTLTVVATSIGAGRIDTGTQALDLRATNGDLTLTGPASGGTITLGATGRISLTQVIASGALTVSGGSGLGFGDIAGASIDVTSAGAITGTAARSGGALTARGTALSLDRATAGSGMALTATTGDLLLGGLVAGGDVTANASGSARVAGAVTAGGAYRVSGATVALGGDGVVQRAAGDVRVTATAGDITGARGLTLTSDADAAGGEPIALDAAGGIVLAGTRLFAGNGGGAALGLRAASGRAIRLGSVQASRIGGLDGGTVSGTLVRDGNFEADDLTIGSMGIALGRGDVAIGRIVASGDVAVRTAGGAIALGEVRGGGVDLASSGALTTGALTSTGAATLRGERIDVAGRLAVARQLLAEARAALTLRDGSAGGAMTLTAGDTLTAGALDAAAIAAKGAGVTLAGARAGDALALTSSRGLSLGIGSAGGAATLDVAGLATIGGLSAGPSVAIVADDVALNGPLKAQAVTFANRAAATTTMRIGDNTGADGYRLSDAEVRQVSADALRFDAGSGAMELGTLTLGTASGRTVELLGTGDIRVIGAVSTLGEGRSVRIGGGRDGGDANAIHVVATRDGGGRLLFDGSDVDLRGGRIAVGLASGFIDTLQPGAAGLAQAQALIGNGNSALYNPQFGGGFYDPGATTTLAARTLTVHFGDYALFQNTAIPGQFSGLRIGGTTAAPVTPALRITSFGTPAQASVALFGTINGVEGAGAALLGSPVIAIDPLLLPNSRINGCLAGSGAGCITTIVIQPTLQVFDWNSEEVFGIARDVTVPFAPVIGGNNEELLSDLPSLAPQSPADRKGEP